MKTNIWKKGLSLLFNTIKLGPARGANLRICPLTHLLGGAGGVKFSRKISCYCSQKVKKRFLTVFGVSAILNMALVV